MAIFYQLDVVFNLAHTDRVTVVYFADYVLKDILPRFAHFRCVFLANHLCPLVITAS